MDLTADELAKVAKFIEINWDVPKGQEIYLYEGKLYAVGMDDKVTLYKKPTNKF